MSKHSREVWQTHLESLQKFAVREGHAAVPLHHMEDGFKLGVWVNDQRKNRASMSFRRVWALEAIPGWHWHPNEEKWLQWYNLLKRFVAREGHACVPQHHEEDGFKLGGWVSTQRCERDSMPTERKQALESLVSWSWNSFEDTWRRHYKLLQQYAEQEGHGRVPADHEVDGILLGQWVSRQRNLKTNLPKHRFEALEAIPGWSWTPIEDNWHRAFALLGQFVRREGHAYVPGKHVERGFKLGVWIMGQRAHQSTMPDDRIKSLEAVPGWSWSPNDDHRRQMFALVKSFADREGHARVPKSHVEDGIALGHWVQQQRRRRLTMARPYREILESFPGWSWNPEADDWNDHFALLQVFIEREGHTLLPRRHVEDGFSLGQWIAAQRRKFKQGQLSPDRRDRLAALPSWTWNFQEERNWQHNFDSLVRFIQREGHAGVPQGYRENKIKLGDWVDQQIDDYLKGTISDAHRRRLEQISAWHWPRRPDDKANFINMDIGEQTELVFEILFGQGPLSLAAATKSVVTALKNKGLAAKRQSGKHLTWTIERTIRTAVEYGYLDEPQEGFVRAIITDVKNYELADWRMCVEKALGERPNRGEDDIKAVLHWAVKNTGLQLGRVDKRGLAYRRVRELVGIMWNDEDQRQ